MSGLDPHRRLAALLASTKVGALSAGELSVVTILLFHADEDLVAWPSQDTITELSGLNRRTVQRALTRLVDRGLIRVLSKGAGRRSSRIQLFPDVTVEAVERVVAGARGGAATAPTTVEAVGRGGPTTASEAAPEPPLPEREAVAQPPQRRSAVHVEAVPRPPEPKNPSTPHPIVRSDDGGGGVSGQVPEAEPEPVPSWFATHVGRSGIGKAPSDLWPAFDEAGGTEPELVAVLEAAPSPALAVTWILAGREAWEPRIPEPPKPRTTESIRAEGWLLDHGVGHSDLAGLADGFSAAGGTLADLEVLEQARVRAGFESRDLVTWLRTERTWRTAVADELAAQNDPPEPEPDDPGPIFGERRRGRVIRNPRFARSARPGPQGRREAANQ